ncbi:MAG: efflux RND transporter permease subunit [Candidatus Paracaedimonas acanthamoebae]|uniref:Efflux RND transporter permease subunit n=1 Tax=Candidatus Paracaedimonas acanthamoebae TaxID=244581 RepID=A0A8J7PZU2_9PROT|nr:efflux RND transporter permease subunit [Candidatus Paracaedimonas acanthamoebae]
MNLTDICIRRPVLSTVMSLVIILLGIVTWTRLQVRQYPNVDEPKISIITQFEGASPEIIEAQVTKPLEDALSGIEGLYLMTSSSEVEESRITLVFELNRSIEAAANDVRDRISRIRNKLPNDVSDPRIKKADADAFPFMYLAVYSDRHDTKDIADYARRFLESQLEVINGVSSVEIFGGGEYEMHIYLDPVKMASYQITAEDVAQSLKKQNIEKPAGRIITKDREITVTTKAALSTEKDFNNLIIFERDGYLVRLEDIGEAKLDAIDTRSRVRFNDKNAVAIGLIKQSIANPLDIALAVKKQLPRLREGLPRGMQMEVANDKTVYIERSIQEVYHTLFEATILVILVILAFLRSFRAIIIPIVTIPVSLIGAFALMYWLGFTINTLTLLALVLAIGLVVDDAIIVLENIYRHIEEGMHPVTAAFKGAREISFAVVAMTITLAAVYAPIALSTGQTGRLFTEFALTLAGSVLISGFVALTLSPMMCSRLLKSHNVVKVNNETNAFNKYWNVFETKSEKVLVYIDTLYESALKRALTKRWTILATGFVIASLGYYLFKEMPSELIPREDQGIVNARAIPPYGANIDFTNKYMLQVDNIMKGIPEMEKRLTLVNVPGESTILGVLLPWEKRKRRSQEIVEGLRDPMYDITGLSVSPSVGGKSLVGGLTDTPVEVVIETTKTYKELVEMADGFMKTLHGLGALQDIYADYGAEGQELVVTVDRDKAASLGIDVSTVGESLDTLISGRSPSKFKRENKLYNVKVWLEEDYRRSADDLSMVFLRGSKDRKETMVPLSEIVEISKRLAPTAISHFSGLRSVTFSAKLRDGFSLGNTLQLIKEQGYKVLPEGTRIDFAGESRRYLEESSNILLIFGLALIFIFLVLSAQYESYIDPLIILFSVPLSLAGGIFLLKLFGQTINLYSQIGLITLIGLITKHGILIVDFANKLKADGLSRIDAVVEASRLRLRPILMTTFAMVLGAVPLAFASGAGAESRRPIGLVIVGGMTLGTLFTLFVVPAIYTFLSRKKVASDLSEFNEKNRQ